MSHETSRHIHQPEFSRRESLKTSAERLAAAAFAAMIRSLTICSLIVFAVTGLAEEPLVGVNGLAAKLATLNPANPDLLADAELFHKGVVRALRYDTPLTPSDDSLVKKALASGLRRAEALAAKKTDWTTKKGKVLRGFISAVDGSTQPVDGSTQPYGVVVPESYDSTRPMRLDVVLHGTSRPVGMSIHEVAYPAKDHAPVFICASPLAANRCIVITSGHTFHEKEFAAFNYLLFPRLGDWAMMKISPGSDQWQSASPEFPEEVMRAGYFDETWRNAITMKP